MIKEDITKHEWFDLLEMKPHCDLRFGDCIEGMSEMPENSVDLTVTSIPFGALFSYSHKQEDIGNNVDGTDLHAGQFGLHMRFVIDQLFRIHKPGTICCIHIQQLLRTKTQHGYMGMRDLRGSIISMFGNHGWQEHGEVAICKNPRDVAKRIKLHSLMFVTCHRNSRALAPAMNDYVLFFRKPGDGERSKALIDVGELWTEKIKGRDAANDDQLLKKYIQESHEYIHYDRKRNRKFVLPEWWDRSDKPKGLNLTGWVTKCDWIRTAHGVWNDIMEIDTLDGWKCARESDQEKHVCPLQKPVIRRCIKLYSCPGDTVLDPFMGIGTTAHVAIEQGRHSVGFELKESYHKMSKDNIDKTYDLFFKKSDQMELFD